MAQVEDFSSHMYADHDGEYRNYRDDSPVDEIVYDTYLSYCPPDSTKYNKKWAKIQLFFK